MEFDFMILVYIAIACTVLFWWFVGFVALLIAVVGAIGFKTACVAQRVRPPEKDEKRIHRAGVRIKNNNYMLSHTHEDVELNTADGIHLTARLIPAEKETKNFVICIHGHNCNGPDEMSHLFPFYHNEMGFNYFLPDLRGHGRSSGKYITFGALDYKDINLWIDYLVDRFGDDIKIMLHGISMGAATSMLVNNHNPAPQVKMIVEDCGYTNAFEQVGIKTRSIAKFLRTDFVTHIINIYCKIFARYDLKKDADPIGTMKNAKNPVLFVHGKEDALVPYYMAEKLYEACPTEKELFAVDGAEHAFSYYDAKDEYDERMRRFIAKHFDATVAAK